MNSMFNIAIKSLLGHKLRMMLTVFSIVIGVSFVAGTYIFTDSMNSTFDSIFEDAYASIDLTVRPERPEFGEGATTVPKSLLTTLRTVDSIDKIEPEAAGSAQLIDKEGELIGGQGAPALGFSWSQYPEVSTLKIKNGNGRAPENAGEVAIDVNTVENNDLSLGETISIQANGPVEEFEIVGFVTFGEANTLAGATLSVFEFSEAQRIFGLGEEYTQISMTAVEGVSPEELKEQVDGVIGEGYESVTAQEQTDENTAEVSEGLGFLTTALLSFAGISIFVGSFIIQNTFRIIVAQRSKELALLRAVGATRRQVVSLVVYEAFVIALFSSAIGLFMGIAISNGLRGISNALGFGLPPGDLTLESRTIYVSFAVGIIVTVLSALMPAIKASRVSPVEGMSDNEVAAPRKSLRKRTISGLSVTSLGAALLLYGLFASVSNPMAIVGFGAGLMFIGISIIAPLLSKPIANIVGYPVAFRYGIVGRIAKGNTKRTPRRTASTAAALMIGVSLVTFVSIFASSIKLTIDRVIDGSFPGDFAVTSKLQQTDPLGATFSGAVAEEISNLDEVSQVTSLKYDFMKISGNELLIVAIEPDTFNSALYLDPIDEYENLGEGSVYVREEFLSNLGKSVGDTLDVEYALTGESILTITGTFKDAFDSPYLISSETYANNFSNKKDLMVVANTSEGSTHEEAKIAINTLLEEYPLVQSQDKGELIVQTREQVDQILGLMSALLGFAVIIAMLGITNTLTLSVSERTRELGMLRAVGMTRPQMRKMIRAEAIIIAVFGAILGVIMGVFFGWAILKALEDIGFSAFSIPATQILVYLVMSAFAGVIAAVLPSIKASRMNILEAINHQ